MTTVELQIDVTEQAQLGEPLHNFAGTRELLWRRLDMWGQWVATNKARR